MLVVWLSVQSPFLSVTAPESTVLEAILRHSKLVTEAIQQMTELKHFSSEDEHLAEIVKEVGSGGVGKGWWGH